MLVMGDRWPLLFPYALIACHLDQDSSLSRLIRKLDVYFSIIEILI